MFVDTLAKKNSINSGFYFDYVVDEEGKLVHIFWADTTCRKNYSHYGELISFDATYNTNEYNMKFTPFTGVNHHGSCVLLGAALILDETIESYVWLFNTFLKAMGGSAPRLIITDEDASMKAAIAKVFPTTVHRLCMWHILMKFPDKVGAPVREDREFYKRLNHFIYSSETTEEFESEWAKIIMDYGLEGNEWLAYRYHIRASWISAYFRDTFLGEILRTTSRSESANSFFKCFIGYKHTLVEFWVRFDTAVEEQRQKELIQDNASFHTLPILKTGWPIEKHGSEVLTYEIFLQFQKEVLAARDNCMVDSMSQDGCFKIYSIIDEGPKVRQVNLALTTMRAHCSCMLFQRLGYPCRHIIYVLRGAKLNELPSHYVLKRWTKNCKREIVYDADENLLEEKERACEDTEFKRMASEMHKGMEEIFHKAGGSIDTMHIVRNKFQKFMGEVKQEIPANQRSKAEEIEGFIGCDIPSQINILPPNEIHSRGRVKIIKGHFDKGGGDKKKEDAKRRKNEMIPRLCGSCKELVLHDKRTCPKKKTPP
ncbi:protein FAR1-RELATED SEQUENCE 5-like [Phragmites australis]|uniref:protein FAR1-RELATED SEQUENCE 5-like n=1 Tax=Phragmites australis TaxID=29695 RepID=UPI002D79D0B3|nr:protein FAR1-RELATED SEQUENCE 5-like [Phragmites australis]